MTFLVAWLVEKGLPSWLAEIVIWLVIGIILFLVAITFWETKVHHPYVKEGMDKQLKIDTPIINNLKIRAETAEKNFSVASQANVDLQKSIEGPGGLRDQVKEANATIDSLTKIANQARAQARAALAKLQAQAKRDADEIEKLRAAAAGPPIVEQVCEKANTVLNELAAWRLMQ